MCFRVVEVQHSSALCLRHVYVRKEKRKRNNTPLGVSQTRSQVVNWADRACLCDVQLRAYSQHIAPLSAQTVKKVICVWSTFAPTCAALLPLSVQMYVCACNYLYS